MHKVMAGGALALGVLTPSGAEAQNAGGNRQLADEVVLSAALPRGGSFTGVLDPATARFCYMLNAAAVDDPTAAHIHAGGPGETGRPVVPIETPEGGASGGCLTLEAEVARSLSANPGGYYINVHSTAYPAGASRGQLRG